MALKKTAAKKTTPKAKTVKRAAAKTSAAKTSSSRKAVPEKPAIKKGSKLSCQVCGFAITVDRVCGCIEEAHLVCCDTPMKLKRPSAAKK